MYLKRMDIHLFHLKRNIWNAVNALYFSFYF